MSITPFIYDWRGDSWDRAECVKRDDDGNPQEIRFYRKSKHILTVYINYNDDGDWTSIKTEKPKKPSKSAKKGYG